MKLGTVIGRITLSQQEPVYRGGQLLVVQPLTRDQLTGADTSPVASGSSLIVYDQLGAGQGATIGYTEGAEASQPFSNPAPVDAYNACIVHQLDYRPPSTT
ncbi:EutN/CcmL family microcompartment protein [Actomonas aquatica]|uniref:EutN/CcmL family microcompartment protein n=1 Tax=Actomonas aquatica TaxID=2866162 RepID=A0ABZ1C7E5_9BACT|nr:EutN/CcmL family microcompartment protein [Opitutus sp. WL0086]WRQ87644.1 EutN/CcmL family microcompartment protein [Opitutus sp. WL0086]